MMELGKRLKRITSQLTRNMSGAVAVETALIMAALSGAFIFAVPDLSNFYRASSQLNRATQLTTDLIGSLGNSLNATTVSQAFLLTDWAMQPFSSNELSARVDAFILDGANARLAWTKSRLRTCNPPAVTPAVIKPLFPPGNASVTVLVVTTCYRAYSVTGFLPTQDLVSRYPQIARFGEVKCDSCS
ncbi:MAG: hypothetical protein U1E46_11955 [Hyphomicrobiales bacterium]